MDFFVRQRFFLQYRRLPDALELPRRDVGELLVIALALTGFLMFLAEVATARFVAH